MTDRPDPEAAAIRAAAGIIVEAVLRLLDDDNHDWTSRPCQSCSAVTALAGRPFGCVRVARQRKDAERGEKR